MKKYPMFKKEGTCSICKGPYNNYGHNPEPVKDLKERCCTECNDEIIIPVRLKRLLNARARDALGKVSN